MEALLAGLPYFLLGFMFLMFVGQNKRLGTLEICVAALVEHHEIQINMNKKYLEFQHEVNNYFKELDTYGKSLDERILHVENTIIAGE